MSITCQAREAASGARRAADDPAMTTVPAPPHPVSAAAFLRTAEAHELAALVLRHRNPTVSKVHADAAVGLRAKASRT